MTEHERHDLEAEQRIKADVEKYGCNIVLLECEGYLPSFAYTIGLFKNYKHPEIICFGLSNELFGALLNYAKDLIQEGEILKPNQLYPDFLEGYDVQFLEVKKEHYADYLGYGYWFYGNTFEFPVLQLLWPDKKQLFTYEAGFNPNWQFKQPLLDRNTDFKFYEARNLGIFTTKQALEGAPILYVYHNLDGDWQFYTSENPNLEDAIVVSLEEMVKRDATLNKIHHLEFGWRAWRNSVNDAWETKEYEFEEDNTEN